MRTKSIEDYHESWKPPKVSKRKPPRISFYEKHELGIIYAAAIGMLMFAILLPVILDLVTK